MTNRLPFSYAGSVVLMRLDAAETQTVGMGGTIHGEDVDEAHEVALHAIQDSAVENFPAWRVCKMTVHHCGKASDAAWT